jgi:hypothetical protein
MAQKVCSQLAAIGRGVINLSTEIAVEVRNVGEWRKRV